MWLPVGKAVELLKAVLQVLAKPLGWLKLPLRWIRGHLAKRKFQKLKGPLMQELGALQQPDQRDDLDWSGAVKALARKLDALALVYKQAVYLGAMSEHPQHPLAIKMVFYGEYLSEYEHRRHRGLELAVVYELSCLSSLARHYIYVLLTKIRDRPGDPRLKAAVKLADYLSESFPLMLSAQSDLPKLANELAGRLQKLQNYRESSFSHERLVETARKEVEEGQWPRRLVQEFAYLVKSRLEQVD